MRWQHKYSILLTVCLFPFLCEGQEKFWIKKVSLGQSSDNALTQAQPGQFTYLKPQSDTLPGTYVINGYISLFFLDWKGFNVSATAELQKNTLISKKQDVMQFGGGIQKIFHVKKEPSESGFEPFTPEWDVYLTTTILYSNDFVKKKEGGQGSFGLSHSFPKAWKKLNFLRPNVYWPEEARDGAKWFQMLHQYSLGLDYLGQEALLMTNFSGSLDVYPFNIFFKKFFKQYNILQIKGTYVNRGKLNDSPVDAGVLYSLGAAFNYKLDGAGKSSVGLGWDRIDGANPMKGLTKQSYDQVSLKFLLSI